MVFSLQRHVFLPPPSDSPIRQMTTHWTDDHKLRVHPPSIKRETRDGIYTPTWREVFDESYGENSREGHMIEDIIGFVNDDQIFEQEVMRFVETSQGYNSLDLNSVEQFLLKGLRKSHAGDEKTFLKFPSLEELAMMAFHPLVTLGFFSGAYKLFKLGLIEIPKTDEGRQISITEKGRAVLIGHEFFWLLWSQFPRSPKDNGGRGKTVSDSVFLGWTFGGRLAPT